MNLQNFDLTHLSKTSLTSIFIVVGALIAKMLSTLLVNYAIKKLEDDDPENTSAVEQRAQTLGSLIKNIFNVAIYGTAFVILLDEWGINIAPILTGAGVIGLAVGFGSQALVRDTVTGFFILFENQFNVGDKVKVAGIEGNVVEMGIRTTILRDSEGVLHIIPNSQIGAVANYSKSSLK